MIKSMTYKEFVSLPEAHEYEDKPMAEQFYQDGLMWDRSIQNFYGWVVEMYKERTDGNLGRDYRVELTEVPEKIRIERAELQAEIDAEIEPPSFLKASNQNIER